MTTHKLAAAAPAIIVHPHPDTPRKLVYEITDPGMLDKLTAEERINKAIKHVRWMRETLDKANDKLKLMGIKKGVRAL